MFELPEFITLSRQINTSLVGKIVQDASLGNSPHKFVWYNRTPKEFAGLVTRKTVGESYTRGNWLFIPLQPGYVLVFGECGGRLLYHPSNERLPAKFHLHLAFDDGSQLSAMTQMWGAMELYETGQELHRQYIKDMRLTPVDDAFTLDYFIHLVAEFAARPKRSVKSLLTQDQLLPGIGNGLAQDILFKARLHPKHPLDALDSEQQSDLYYAIVEIVQQVIAQGGRSEEYDLFNRPGGYQRIMNKQAAGHPCPRCGQTVEKIQYLGGACYFCPGCQI
jgi:formamidopyrimidine-DNA glycosylase